MEEFEDRVKLKHRLAVWLGAALLFGTISFYAEGVSISWPPFGYYPIGYYPAIRLIGVVATWFWIASVLAAPFYLRWRALWLVITVPLVLAWPYVDYQLNSACTANRLSCP
jgi:hypothetical protein